MSVITEEKVTAEIYTPTDHLGSFSLEFRYDDGRVVGALVNGVEIGPAAAEIILDAISGHTRRRS